MVVLLGSCLVCLFVVGYGYGGFTGVGPEGCANGLPNGNEFQSATLFCTLNATDPASVERLQRWLAPGITAVLVGSSGVGKSTLTNALTGAETMKTGAVRASDSRGRHTTTHRALIALTAGACLIDTPGMRELKPTGEEDLAEDGFADVEALAAQCRFRDCRHASEPGCAVRAAIEAGTLDAARFANYRKLSDEIAGAGYEVEDAPEGPRVRPLKG